jgi:hypothetical protein
MERSAHLSAKERSMLKILLAACETTRDALTAADNAVDTQLLADLERMIERTRGELGYPTSSPAT